MHRLLPLLLLACGSPETPPDRTHSDADPWSHPSAPAGWAPCASCHLADASGRPDGAIPHLAGQSETVLRHKLQRLRDGHTHLPVMLPFARAMTPTDLDELPRWLASLPPPVPTGVPQAAEAYTHCAACHGPSGEGSDALLAPRLCAQHAGYLLRRTQEVAEDVRGDASPGMQVAVASLSQADLVAIADHLASTPCSSVAP